MWTACFVARYSENALTAVSLAFPLQTLIVACSVGIGVGVNSYIARKLGRRQEEADSAVIHGLLLALTASILFVTAGAFCIEPFFRMFTDDGAILADGLIYARICVGFCFGPFIHICIEKIFQGNRQDDIPDGAAGYWSHTEYNPGSYLDFRLFWLTGHGRDGSAVATVIGQMTSMGLSFSCWWLFSMM